MISDLLNAGIFTSIINFILSAVQVIVKVFLYPIDLLIDKLAPTITIQPITDFFSAIAQFTGLILKYTWIPTSVIALAIVYLIFSITATAGVFSFKLIIKWYNALKP